MSRQANGNDPQKQENQKRRHFAFRLNVFFFCTFVFFSILIVRLAMLQFVEGKELTAMENETTEKVNSIPPIRGNIYDDYGAPLAVSTPTQSIFYLYDSRRNEDDVIALAKKLSVVFAKYGNADKKMTPEEIMKEMDVGYDINKKETRIIGYAYQPRRIKSDLSQKELAYLLEHRDEYEGIEIVEESTRKYVKYGNNPLAPQLIGYLRPYSVAREDKWGLDFYKKIAELKDPKYEYLDSESVGFDGLELMYQDDLRGKNGYKTYPVNSQQQITGQFTITKPEKGNDLYLSLNSKVQQTTEKAILDQLAYMKSPAARALRYPAMGSAATTGYAVAMEVKTGKIVAMASMPDYDSNIWSKGHITQQELELNQFSMGNGAIREVYPPYKNDRERSHHPTSLVPLGSTMKPLTVLLGLNEKLITANEIFHDGGYFAFGGKGHEVRVWNSDHHPYGSLNAEDAIRVSSNAYMAGMIGNRLYMNKKDPLKIWDSYMKKFGLGIKTGSNLPGEIAGTIDYFKEAERSGGEQSPLIYAAFGQQGRYTPLQLAQYAAMLANRGKRLKPQFVNEIKDHEGNLVQTFRPQVLNEVKLPNAYWNVVEQGMIKVHKEGFDDFPYTVAAKTGTSQQQVAGHSEPVENAVFIAYAPVGNPTLAVAVVVPEGGYGAWGAAPIARKIFDAYDEQIGLTGVPKKKTQTTGQNAK